MYLGTSHSMVQGQEEHEATFTRNKLQCQVPLSQDITSHMIILCCCCRSAGSVILAQDVNTLPMAER